MDIVIIYDLSPLGDIWSVGVKDKKILDFFFGGEGCMRSRDFFFILMREDLDSSE